MTRSARTRALGEIRQNIQRHGFHRYLVQQGLVPRFAYTIGLRDTVGAELVLAGAIHYLADQVTRIMNTIGRQLIKTRSLEAAITVRGLGQFTLRPVHRSWTSQLLLGALDYYDVDDVAAYQIVPDADHWTVDVPDLAKAYSPVTEPIWRWLQDDWSFPIPDDSTATTNLDALRGARTTEVMRWEDDTWEIFAGAGPDVARKDVRIVPLGRCWARIRRCARSSTWRSARACGGTATAVTGTSGCNQARTIRDRADSPRASGQLALGRGTSRGWSAP